MFQEWLSLTGSCHIPDLSSCQTINQFYFLLSATSSMPLALYNGTHTLVWTHTYTYGWFSQGAAVLALKQQNLELV